MDFNIQKLLKGQNNNIGEAVEDRISKLPDSLLHKILSPLDTKLVAQTSVLSKRWNHIWRSIPALDFFMLDFSGRPPSLSEVNKFMDFLERTLLLHDASSNIQKFSLRISTLMSASRVHSWVSSITSRNVEELRLYLDIDRPFHLPMSLFTCESLTKLELCSGNKTIHVPKCFHFPKLKSLKLCCFKFIDDDGWNEQHFSNCPVLEKLVLQSCGWSDISKFSILTPVLKVLEILGGFTGVDGLQDCVLEIYAPSLVSLTYSETVAKHYYLSGFQTLEFAKILFNDGDADARRDELVGAAVTKLFQALPHVQSLTIDIQRLQALLDVDGDADDFVNGLPTFHNLNELELSFGPVTDKLIFALLKAAPNLKTLLFEWVFMKDLDAGDDDNDDDDGIVYDKTEDLFQHLQSVKFTGFNGEAREFRWVKLILKNAKSLQTMTVECEARYSNTKSKEVVMSEFQSFPRASERCVFKVL